MNEQKIKTLEERVQSASQDSRLSCAMALKIAKDLAVSPALVGETVNRLKIKLHSCQLGCFK